MWTAADALPAFPRDVEEVIYELPEVREAVVVAIANQPIAFVSLNEKANVPARTIIAICKRRLPAGQVPRLVIFIKDSRAASSAKYCAANYCANTSRRSAAKSSPNPAASAIIWQVWKINGLGASDENAIFVDFKSNADFTH